MRYQRKVKQVVRDRAWSMRNNPTASEAVLWERLRLRRLSGFRFRRQAIVFGFIADFYCPKSKVIVEIDGGYHSETTEYDAMRQATISSVGLRVLRFSDDMVHDNIDAVCADIAVACHAGL